jgi:hypothetical protein
MVWKRLFGNNNEEEKTATAPPLEGDAANRPASGATPKSMGGPVRSTAARDIPPHLAQVIERRNAGGIPERTPEQRQLDGLRRQRMAILFDIEQGEAAAAPDNPWTQRMSLLTEAMAMVEQDIRVASVVEASPFVVLPETPIVIDGVSIDEVATVTFAIGGETFVYAEDPDWADRSRTITRGDLQRRAGQVSDLMPATTPADLTDALRFHLDESLMVFATDLRDTALDEESFPTSATLADLARACPICGGWTDWRGTCQACAQRQASLTALRREATRLLDERTIEAEERHKLIEGLPLARRRLRDVDADLARLGDQTT